MKVKNALVVYYVHNYKTLDKVEKCLRSHGINYRATRRINLTPQICRNRDLIIVVGGDGTFLRTSRHVHDNTPVLNVSSDTKFNEAFYSMASPDDFENKFEKILRGKFKIVKLPRLEAKINGHQVGMLAVNELFVGSAHPYHTSRYVIKVRNKSEFQKSSGVLITTRTGRTGWAKSAAKKRLNISKAGFGYVVREPYFGKLTKPRLLAGSLNSKEKIRIDSEMRNGIAVVDSSTKEYKFTDGYKLEVGVSKHPISLIEF